MTRRESKCAALAVIITAGSMMLVAPSFGQTTVTSFAPFSETPTPGVWYEADVRPGGVASIVDLTGFGGDLETAIDQAHVSQRCM